MKVVKQQAVGSKVVKLVEFAWGGYQTRIYTAHDDMCMHTDMGKNNLEAALRNFQSNVEQERKLCYKTSF